MLTSLDRDESPNFFSHSRIKLFKIEYREMTLATVHFNTCCERCKVCDCTTLDSDGHLGTPGQMVTTAFEVSYGGCLLPQRVSRAHCIVRCAHTSDPGSLHCNHSPYNLWLQLAVHFSDAPYAYKKKWCCLKRVQRMTALTFTHKETKRSDLPLT